MGYLVGIDIGTSGTKSLVINESGRVLAQAAEEYPVFTPHPGWSQQDPADWWRAAVATVREVLRSAHLKPQDVSGVGLSGQMHGSCFLDKTGSLLAPCILWNDQRTAAECDEITRTVGAKRLIELVLNPALAGFTAPKILWFRKHEPAAYEKTVKVLLPKDYIRFRMTGEFATEVSDASGTLLLDVTNRTWSKEVLSALDINRALLPDCYESEEVSGRLSKAAAGELGLAEGTPVVGGGGDQAAGAVGNGIVREGVISATMGTSGVVFAHSDEPVLDPGGRVHTFCHAVRGAWHVMGVVLSAGGSFQWLRNNLADQEARQAGERGLETYDVLCEKASQAPAGSDGLIFLPYLTGERTPHADPFALGAWVGLSARHDKPRLIRSVMEGATYAMKDSFEIIRSMGVSAKEVRLSGGGARSALWRQIQADIYGCEVSTVNAEQGPAYGAALLAGVGTGVWSSVPEACDATIEVVSKQAPDPQAEATYAKFYPLYGKLYRSLKDDFKAISQAVRG